MVYSASDVSNISDEVVAMMSAYIPAMMYIFGMLFALWFARKLFKTWTGY